VNHGGTKISQHSRGDVSLLVLTPVKYPYSVKRSSHFRLCLRHYDLSPSRFGFPQVQVKPDIRNPDEGMVKTYRQLAVSSFGGTGAQDESDSAATIK
jgi:hypothetical protein